MGWHAVGMYKLYVIPGSHACRSAMLMLEHKEVPYRRVDIVTLTHPMVVRLHGFDAGGQTRTAGGHRTFGLRLGDRLGTVPALAAGSHRISTNHGIARFLEARHPEPPLFPSDPEERAAVEEVERWANETLQMAARRIPGAAALRDPAEFTRSAGRRPARVPALQAGADAAFARPEDSRAGSSPPARKQSPSCWTISKRCSIGSTRGSPTGCWADRN